MQKIFKIPRGTLTLASSQLLGMKAFSQCFASKTRSLNEGLNLQAAEHFLADTSVCGTWFSGHGGEELTAGPDDLSGLFQP